MFFRDKVVLITGASSGIGEELAWQLVHAEARVTLAARRKELLEAVATRIAAAGKPRPAVVECDVTRDGDLERAVTESVRKFGKLDVAIANAGFGWLAENAVCGGLTASSRRSSDATRVRWAALRGAKIVFHPHHAGSDHEGCPSAALPC